MRLTDVSGELIPQIVGSTQPKHKETNP